jgi:hypothetical protein
MLRKKENQQRDTSQAYLRRLVNVVIESWSNFWFQESTSTSLPIVRVCLGCIVSLLSIEGLLSLRFWIARDGVLPVGLTRSLIGVGRDWDSLFRTSALYLLDWPIAIQVYFFILFVAGLLLAAGIGGRLLAAIVYVMFIGVCHRVPVISGPGDYLLSAMLLYLVVDTGKLNRVLRPGLGDRSPRLTTNIALRLMQVHLWMWMLFSVLSQLAAVIWWEGEAVWFLTASHRSFLETNFLAKNAILVNLLTHGLIVAQVVAVACLAKPLTRPIGWIAAVTAWFGIGLFSGDVSYAVIGAAASLCFLNEQPQPKP